MPRFVKGNKQGEGRPPGSRNKSAMILDAIGFEGIENTIRMVKDKADNQGSLRAANILLARAWPRNHGRPVLLGLPSVEAAGGIVQAHARLVALMSEGEVTPEQASAISNVLDNQRKALETYDHEQRIQELEAERKRT
jgi:hypothetical protein